MEKSASNIATHPDDFIINFKYYNNLPNAPSGPYLKNISSLYNNNKLYDNHFPEFRTSTLEKGYIWQPHFGNDLGIKLDLADQDLILTTQDKSNSLDQSDLRYLTGTVDNSRGKLKQIDQSSKPWWLRNTTYLENNLFNTVRAKEKALEPNKVMIPKNNVITNKKDMFSTDFISESFSIVDDTVKNLIAKSNKNKVVISDIPLLPCQEALECSKPSQIRYHSLVRFDEDPKLQMNNTIMDDGNQQNKRQKISDTLITNLRHAQNGDTTKTQSSIEVSLVSSAGNIAVFDKNNQSLVSSSDENNIIQVEESCSSDIDRIDEWIKCNWIKDYQMEVHHIEQPDSFIFVYNKNNNIESTTNTSDSNTTSTRTTTTSNISSNVIEYYPIKARVDMKKLPIDDSLPHDTVIKRDLYANIFDN